MPKRIRDLSKARDYCAAWRRKNLGYARNQNLKAIYGISQKEYQDMYDAQDGLCGICQNHEKTLNVDHDHETGLIRGLLCGKCNKAIGLLDDSIETLYSAIDYLECHGIECRMAELTATERY